MEKETKKHLIVGVALVVSIGIGVVVWKKYQSSSSATAAASNQSNQDQLALELAALSANAYAGQSGGAQTFSSPAAVSSGPQQTLSEEVIALENALGFGPAPTPAPATPTIPTATTPTTPTAPTTTTTPIMGGSGVSEMIRYNHGEPLFSMDGVTHEGLLI